MPTEALKQKCTDLKALTGLVRAFCGSTCCFLLTLNIIGKDRLALDRENQIPIDVTLHM
jgi:hypothetical protein